MSKRKICVVTGSRAEYGQLFWLLKEIRNDAGLQLQLIVTGMHLSPEFGLTHKVIDADGFNIDAKVEVLMSSDTPVGISKSIGLGVIGFAEAFERLRPDVVVVLGDRYEIFAAAQAAMVARIPLAHIHGGESTEGVIDEPIRHAITKMAQFHFVAAEAYRRRVIQLGESPTRVFKFGAPALDNLKRLKLLDRRALEKSIDFTLGNPSFIVTYHPVTLSKGGAVKPVENLLRALDQFPAAKIIFTKSNSDTDGRVINQMIDRYAAARPAYAKSFTSLGQLRYLSALKQMDVMIGNSSSGLLEAPALKVATVNIGARQKGRLKAASVVDCSDSQRDIAAAIKKTLSAAFRKKLARTVSPYEGDDVSIKIKRYLKSVDLRDVLMKKFHVVNRRP
jgi:UDP-N-acetylglucosamine 2-epimerase (non-hydrolysing)/GDP/UDP-N,N'-diacetylbacillosamine 2-epimerase (hydrolysing)